MPATSEIWLEADEDVQMRNKNLAYEAETSDEECGSSAALEHSMGYSKKE